MSDLGYFAFGGFFFMYATKMWFLMDQYTDDYFLCETACLNSPDSWFAWHIRGMGRWERKSFQEAVIIWTMARMISPKEFKINFNLATALALAKHKDESLTFLKLAEDNIPAGQEKESGVLIERWKKGEYSIIL